MSSSWTPDHAICRSAVITSRPKATKNRPIMIVTSNTCSPSLNSSTSPRLPHCRQLSAGGSGTCLDVQLLGRCADEMVAQFPGALIRRQLPDLTRQPGDEEQRAEEEEQPDDRPEERPLHALADLPDLRREEEEHAEEQEQRQRPGQQPDHRPELPPEPDPRPPGHGQHAVAGEEIDDPEQRQVSRPPSPPPRSTAHRRPAAAAPVRARTSPVRPARGRPAAAAPAAPGPGSPRPTPRSAQRTPPAARAGSTQQRPVEVERPEHLEEKHKTERRQRPREDVLRRAVVLDEMRHTPPDEPHLNVPRSLTTLSVSLVRQGLQPEIPVAPRGSLADTDEH